MEIYKKITEIRQTGMAAALCVIVESLGSTPRKAGAKMIVYGNGTTEGTIGGGSVELAVIKHARKLIATGNAKLIDFDLGKDLEIKCGGLVKVFIEPLVPNKKLYVFGAGHIGALLAEMAGKFGFSVVLVDDRENFYKPHKDSTINFVRADFEAFCKTIQLDGNSYVCVVTYKHDLDKLIISYCARQKPAYIGMMGSKGKIAKLRKDLLDSKILTENEFAKINAPIGIGIKCETPEEIVVSVLSKLIEIKNRN